MKERLTGKDRITVKKCFSDLNSKNVQSEFDVTVAAFEALIRRSELWEEFLIYFNRSNPDRNLGEPYASWREWAFQTPPFQWVASAFLWDTTPQGRYIWRDLDYNWLQWICRNNVQKSI